MIVTGPKIHHSPCTSNGLHSRTLHLYALHLYAFVVRCSWLWAVLPRGIVFQVVPWKSCQSHPAPVIAGGGLQICGFPREGAWNSGRSINPWCIWQRAWSASLICIDTYFCKRLPSGTKFHASLPVLFCWLVVSGQQFKLISTGTWSSVTTSGMIINSARSVSAMQGHLRNVVIEDEALLHCCTQMTYIYIYDMAFRCQTTEALNSWIEQQEALPDGRICVGEQLQNDPVSWHLLGYHGLLKLFVVEKITECIDYDGLTGWSLISLITLIIEAVPWIYLNIINRGISPWL